jgi:hypothetical protein
VRLQIVYHQHRGPSEQAVQCETSKEVHTATLATATKLNKKNIKVKRRQERDNQSNLPIGTTFSDCTFSASSKILPRMDLEW